MSDLAKWDYKSSIEKVKPMVINWRNLTVELVEELYNARQSLSDRGSWSVVPDGTTHKGWREYLDEVGLAKSTVHRWLERYLPEEKRILEPEELEQKKQIETRAKQNESVKINNRILVYKKTFVKPNDWDEKTEKEYQRQIKEQKEREKRIDEYKKEAEERERRKAEERAKEEEQRLRYKIELEMLNSMAEFGMKRAKQKDEFKKRIKLSQSGESDLFIDALMDYLDELTDDNRRIEACNNIIKVCRNISVELQRGNK
jgi:hypothetical protein